MDSTPVLCVPSPLVAMVRISTTGDQGTGHDRVPEPGTPAKLPCGWRQATVLVEQRERLELSAPPRHPSSP